MNVAMKIAKTFQSWKAYSLVPFREANIPSSILEIVKYPNSNPKVMTNKTVGPLIEPTITNKSRSALSLFVRFVKIANITRRSIAKVTKAARMRPAAMAPMKEESVNWFISILVTVHKFRVTLDIIRLELESCC